MQKLYKTIIIEDEKLASKRMNHLLQLYPDRFEVIGETNNGLSGAKMINILKPDLVFLDIEIPGMNGFEMLKQLEHIPLIIFTTAYENYAVKAFEENSIDYLLKPIEAGRLEKTIEKLDRLNMNPTGFDLNGLLEHIDQHKHKKEISFIPIKTGDKITLLKLEDISYFEAKDKYVFIHDMKGDEHLIDHSLITLQSKLPYGFARIHRAFIINKDNVKEIRKGFNGSYTFIMSDRPVSQLKSTANYGDNIRPLLEL